MNCDFCGMPIPDEVIAKRHYSSNKMPKFVCCDREHSAAYRKQHGMYKDMSKVGKSARSTAVAKSNRDNPRRKKLTASQ